MAEVHHFTYGIFNPLAAYLLAFLGSLLGLMSTGRARAARTRGRRNRWLVIAAFSIGGGAIWLMHFTAMLGFDVPQSPVRYHFPLTVLSMGLAVVTVGAGLMVVGNGRRSLPKIVMAGVITGFGVLGMHYTGMRALHVAGAIHYRPHLVVVSGIIAVVAATVALWFTVSVRGWLPVTGAAAVMAVAVCGMHYTSMAATWVELRPIEPGDTEGLRPLVLIVPITLITAATILGVAMSGLQAMTEEEFTDRAAVPRHAETPWSLKQATLLHASATTAPSTAAPAATAAAVPATVPPAAVAARRPGNRPSPRPVPSRPAAEPGPAPSRPVTEPGPVPEESTVA